MSRCRFYDFRASLGLPRARQCLRLRQLRRRQPGGDQSAIVEGALNVRRHCGREARRGEDEPFVRFDEILFYTAAIIMQRPQIELRSGVFLIGRVRYHFAAFL